MLRIKSWEECTFSQKAARVILGIPFALATVAYLIIGMWMAYALIAK